MEQDKILKVSEVANRLGVHQATILRWIREGRIEASILQSGRYRINEGQISKLLSPVDGGDDNEPKQQ